MSRAVDDNDKVSVAAVYAKDVQEEPIVKGLGIRANKVQILNESDCTRLRRKVGKTRRIGAKSMIY